MSNLSTSESGDGGDKPPIRVCPNCSAQSQTSADECPHCGASFIRSRRMRARRRIGGWSRRRKVLICVAIAALAGAAVAAAAIIKVNHDDAVAAQHREAEERQEAIAAAKKAREATELRERREEEESERELARIELRYGKESVKELEGDITKSANEEAQEGFSEAVIRTDCEAEGGKVDPSLTAQSFHCIAVTTEEGGTEEGYRYTGTINYAEGNISWRFGGP